MSRAAKKRLFTAAWCCCVVAFLSLTGFAAPPKLNSLFPAGASRGQTVSVTLSGTFGQWPVKTWVDRPGIEITADNEKGKLSIAVAPDAAPGVHWLRLYDEEGATSPRPFIVGTIPEVLEVEPNDDLRKPQVLELSTVTINGQLGKAGDVDTYAVALRKDQTLVASMEANRTLGSPMDSSLQVVCTDGFVLDQNDDYHDLDPQIVFTAPADGQYLVRTFAFPATPDSSIRFAGSSEFVYRLTLATSGFVEYAYPLSISRSRPSMVELFGWNISETTKRLPVEASLTSETATLFHPEIVNTTVVRCESHPTGVEVEPNDREHPQEIQLPTTITGRIDPRRDVDAFRFQAKQGDKLVFRVESRTLGFPLDPIVQLTDSAGKTLTEVDDSGGGRDVEMAFTVPSDGAYRLIIRDLHGQGGDRYVYRLSALSAEPDYTLKLAADSFVLTPGKSLEIPVTIDRTNGFAGEIEVNAVGLPDSVSATPVKSLVQGDQAKSVKLTLTASSGPFSGPIRIVGATAGEPKLERTAAAAIAGLNASTSDAWLTVLHAK